MISIYDFALDAYRQGFVEQSLKLCIETLRHDPGHAGAQLLQGVILLETDQVEHACIVLSKLALAAPEFPEAHNALGNVMRRLGRPNAAMADIRTAIALRPDTVEFRLNLGAIQLEYQQLDEALETVDAALVLDPASGPAWGLRGRILRSKGLTGQALIAYRRATECRPDIVDDWLQLNSLAIAEGEIDEAILAAQRVIALAPENAYGPLSLGHAWAACGMLAEAETAYRRAMEIAPDRMDASNALIALLRERRDYRTALEVARSRVVIHPQGVGAWIELARCLELMGDQDGAVEAYDHVLSFAPHQATATIRRCCAHLAIAYRTAEDCAQAVTRYAADLDALIAVVPTQSPAWVKEAATALADTAPFYLSYLKDDLTTLQRRLGTLQSLLSAHLPSPQAPMIGGTTPIDRPLSVGIVSRFLLDHPVWQAIARGWVTGLDSARFRVSCYQLSGHSDSATVLAAHHAAVFHQGTLVSDPETVSRWCDIIGSERHDVVLYPEIGMDPLTARIASYRLAPVQAVSWGHPLTSGLPTIDWYLSGNAFEPEVAEQHYTEQLYRMPGVFSQYQAIPLTPQDAAWRPLGVSADDVLYLSGQTLFKYLPDYDWVYPAIAEEVGPTARFLFFRHGSPLVSEIFETRIRDAFAARGLDASRHCIFHDRVPLDPYLGVLAAADVYLDTIGFSGFNTALQAISQGVPLVTLRGAFLRGRLASGLLDHIGLEDMVSASLTAWIERAITLGRNAPLRRTERSRLLAASPRAFEDKTAITALETFLSSVGGR